MNQQIATIRQRFEEELLQDSSASTRFHPIDIGRVRTEDWQVKRYILNEAGDLDAAYKALIRTLEWKCKWGVHENHLSKYPKEIFDLYSVEAFSEDREGRQVFAEILRGQRHHPEKEPLLRGFYIAWGEHLDRLVGEQGLTYLLDFSGASLLKDNLGQLKFCTGIFSRHYPQLLRRCLMHRVPRTLLPAVKLGFALFKRSLRENVTYTSGLEALFAYIDPVRLHVDYGGGRTDRVYPVAGLASIWTLYPELRLERTFVEAFLQEAQLVCRKELVYEVEDEEEEEREVNVEPK